MAFTTIVTDGFSEAVRLRYPEQVKIIVDVIKKFGKYGPRNKTFLPGKLVESYSGLSTNHPDYTFARDNNLWHYHCGLPIYVDRGKYKTSDVLIHFQWDSTSTDDSVYSKLTFLDIFSHYDENGNFYLPRDKVQK